MCYCRRNECEWNDTHNYEFHAAWKRDLGNFALPADHDYWKLSGNTGGIATGSGDSERSGVGPQD